MNHKKLEESNINHKKLEENDNNMNHKEIEDNNNYVRGRSKGEKSKYAGADLYIGRLSRGAKEIEKNSKILPVIFYFLFLK